jgi:hypothetical protein
MRLVFRGRTRDNFGNVVEGEPIKMYLADTSTPATVYNQETGGTPTSASPQVETDEYGYFEVWFDPEDYDSVQKFDIIIDNKKYNKVDIFRSDAARDVSYDPIDDGDWDADGDPDTPDDVREALDELADTVKNIDGGSF